MGPLSARQFKNNVQREEGSRNQRSDATRWELEIYEKLEPIYRKQVTKNVVGTVPLSVSSHWSDLLLRRKGCNINCGWKCIGESCARRWWDWISAEAICYHEEFDTRLMLHAANAVSHGYKRILIMTRDTDIIALRISFFSDIGADKLWVSFGIGNTLRNISIHDMCRTMSSAKGAATRYDSPARSLPIALYMGQS